jgi:flagellar basal-body rod protein FlgG
MLRIFWTSKSAMNANTNKIDAISNNLANTNTAGYKKIDVNFEDLVSESFDRLGYPESKATKGKNNNFTGTGVKTTEWIRDNKQGNLFETGIPSDLTIDGEGYYQLTTPNGETVYARNGSFQVDAQGRLADSNGNLLNIKYENGFNKNNVKLTKSNFAVKETGEIVVTEAGRAQRIGTIELFNSVGDNSLKSIGQNLYATSTDTQMYKVSNPAIRQGYVEGSNVDVATEISDMIVTQRAFELASKGIKAADEMWGIANNLRSK